MNTPRFKLRNAPIIEAVLDIDCDLPASTNIEDLEGAARDAYRPKYPNFRPVRLQQHRVQVGPDNPTPSVEVTDRGVQGFHFINVDGTQLSQLRQQGFSFNRLAPYTSLDDYIPEMEWAWKQFMAVAAPTRIYVIRLRYINRILLPTPDGKVKLDEYLKIAPHLPDEVNLEFLSFFNQHAAVEKGTGDRVNTILASQPFQDGVLPIIFDITVERPKVLSPNDWQGVMMSIQALRVLKNGVFCNTLKDKCVKMFGLEQAQ